MVWLPGAFHTPEDFLHAGFDTAVARRGLDIDLQFAELALDHLGDRSAIERLARDIVRPAREAGCGTVWLGGISLGGLLALITPRPTPDRGTVCACSRRISATAC